MQEGNRPRILRLLGGEEAGAHACQWARAGNGHGARGAAVAGDATGPVCSEHVPGAGRLAASAPEMTSQLEAVGTNILPHSLVRKLRHRALRDR